MVKGGRVWCMVYAKHTFIFACTFAIIASAWASALPSFSWVGGYCVCDLSRAKGL